MAADERTRLLAPKSLSLRRNMACRGLGTQRTLGVYSQIPQKTFAGSEPLERCRAEQTRDSHPSHESFRKPLAPPSKCDFDCSKSFFVCGRSKDLETCMEEMRGCMETCDGANGPLRAHEAQ